MSKGNESNKSRRKRYRDEFPRQAPPEEELDILDDEPENDEAVLFMGRLLRTLDALPAVVNLEQVDKVMEAYALLKELAREMKDAKVIYKLHEPAQDAGSVTVSARILYFFEPAKFLELAAMTQNMEIYPRTDGTVTIEFGFQGLNKRIKMTEGWTER